MTRERNGSRDTGPLSWLPALPRPSYLSAIKTSRLISTRPARVCAGWLAFGASLGLLSAADWPQLHGPTRNGVYPGTDLATAWPKDGPVVRWQKPAGHGFAGPVVSGGKVILFQRVGDEEVVQALAAKTGQEQWRFGYPTAYVDRFNFDPGPRAVPAVAGGKVFTFGAEGALHCLDLTTGAKVWGVATKREFGARLGFFGLACSPLVEGKAVLVNLGGPDGAGIVAFDTATGKVLWKATDDEASYASPVAATLGGRRLALFLTRGQLVGLDAANGQVAFDFPFRPPMDASVTAASPLVVGDTIFVSASYGTGATVLRVAGGKLEKLWASDEVLSSQYASVVERDGFLYGFDGRVDTGPKPSLRCVELATGKVRWSKEGFGGGTLLRAGDQLLALTERGELVRVKAAPTSYQELARAQVVPFVRAHPALAGGLFYTRSKDKLFCLDLRSQP